MAKNIVVFFDGTGQEGGKGNNTNVCKLTTRWRDGPRWEDLQFLDKGRVNKLQTNPTV